MPTINPRVAQINADIAAQGNKGYSVAPMNPSATSPAREAYTSSLANPLVNAYNAGGGKAMTTNEMGTAIGSKPDYLASYRDYLSQYAQSLNEPAEIGTARTKLADIQNKGEAIDLESRRNYEATLDKSGMLLGGAQQAAAVGRRRSNQELADVALQESAAARSLDALTGTQTAKQNYLKGLLDISQPIQVGDQYIDPTTGETIQQTPKERTGIVGEYEYAKSQGYTGTFEQYQNDDANRKRAAAPKQTEAEKKAIMVGEINDVVSQLGTIVKTKKWKGVNPDDYATMRNYLQQTYGYEGVKELDSAMAVLGLSVDYGKK